MKKALLILTALLYLPTAPVFTDAAPATAQLDSLSGEAVVQRAGTVKWVPVKEKARLHNNDVIRVEKGGVGRIIWPDNTAAYVRGGTQILINIGPPQEKSRLLSYATVLWGSAFFIIRKALPKKAAEDIQIYTPTTVISIRGTSFETTVDPDGGATTVKVICGTVRVRCIAKNASAFISAPFKTMVKKNTDPIVPSALLAQDIDSLRAWVPPPLINAEVARQLAQGKRDQLIISGKLEEKCVILPFADSSRFEGPWNLSKSIPELLTTRMKNEHSRCTIIFADSTFATMDDVATTTGARFIITGTIAFFNIINHAAISVQADEYRERSIARITLDLHITDIKGEHEPFSVTVTGEHSGKKNTANSLAAITKFPFDLADREFAESLIGKALKQAVEAGVEKLTREMFK